MNYKTIPIGGIPYMKSKVVMLPTETKSKIYRYEPKDDNNLPYYREIESEFSPNIKPQHLYFISDEEIKEGDWYYDTLTTLIYKADNRPVTMNCFKKIIATTDSSLKYSTTGEYQIEGHQEWNIPRPSNEFLRAYCKANGKIDEVLIEMEAEQRVNEMTFIGGEERKVEEIWNAKGIKGEPLYFITNNGKHSWACTYKLKVSPDNTITIKKSEEKIYKEDEMFLNMQYYMEYCQREGYITPQKWIEEHKHF